jgi:hypothetical protein
LRRCTSSCVEYAAAPGMPDVYCCAAMLENAERCAEHPDQDCPDALIGYLPARSQTPTSSHRAHARAREALTGRAGYLHPRRAARERLPSLSRARARTREAPKFGRGTTIPFARSSQVRLVARVPHPRRDVGDGGAWSRGPMSRTPTTRYRAHAQTPPTTWMAFLGRAPVARQRAARFSRLERPRAVNPLKSRRWWKGAGGLRASPISLPKPLDRRVPPARIELAHAVY